MGMPVEFYKHNRLYNLIEHRTKLQNKMFYVRRHLADPFKNLVVLKLAAYLILSSLCTYIALCVGVSGSQTVQ
jgi:hypothetical protein